MTRLRELQAILLALTSVNSPGLPQQQLRNCGRTSYRPDAAMYIYISLYLLSLVDEAISKSRLSLASIGMIYQ